METEGFPKNLLLESTHFGVGRVKQQNSVFGQGAIYVAEGVVTRAR